MYDPWEGVPSGWTVTRAAIATRGYCDHSRRLIVVNARLSRAEERCTLTHEIIHAERGPVPAHHAAREERIVDAEAARRLIPLEALLEAVRWACCPAEAAEALGVDVPTLLARIATLTPVSHGPVATRPAVP
jgi:gp43